MTKIDSLKTLGQFIRKKRESTLPEVYNLQVGRRKTSGLRREEVATLSGISISLYTLIEQGQYQHPSVDVLMSIGRTLKMTPEELNHIMVLSSNQNIIDSKPSGELSDDIQFLLDDFSSVSALVLDAYWYILYANENFLTNLALKDVTGKHFFDLLLDDELTKVIENIKDLRKTFISIFRYTSSTLYHDDKFSDLMNNHLLTMKDFEQGWSNQVVLGNPNHVSLTTNINGDKQKYRFLPLYPVTDTDFVIFTFQKT
ncbi:helix-turn-helix domain-containing protein [Acidaminobacter sp. JC074]|uniref:helix-turn-helix domain-containing protein n=1 Tax=Acidaminobacter sp. JC074 TaxID=2530199 RepID=UPI001F112018|nr:helix-turn-helix domain-containing protein [Acidaminobacter sp. JC074]MCH4891385.1 helix-turn-helix domain-containing protein [Acidaminobacter sp. JC074]